MSNVAKGRRGPKPRHRGPCSVEGCDRVAEIPTKGMCEKHYRRVLRRGTAAATRAEPGAGTVTTYGYIAVGVDGGKKQQHVVIAERALGKPLPKGAEVHHINGDRSDNRHENLVICPSRAYHKMLHVRQDALEASGNPGFRKCPFCKAYDNPAAMVHNRSSRYYYHSACKAEYNRIRRSQK